MFSRLMLLIGVALLGMNLGAQPFMGSATLLGNGYGVAEAGIASDGFGGAIGPAVDPTDPDAFYYYDGLTIRRYSYALGAAQGPGAPVFAPPVPAGFTNMKGGGFGTLLVFDPTNPNSLWYAESSEGKLYVIDIDPANRGNSIGDRVAYTTNTGVFLYDIAFDTSTATPRVFLTQGNFVTTEICHVVTSPSTFTAGVIGTVAGASGPIDFDVNGNLYYVVPPFSGTPATLGNEARVIRWLAANVASALTVGGTPLTEANRDPTAQRVLTFAGTPNVFPTVSYIMVRQENGRPIVYAGSNDPQGASATVTGAIMRIDITQAANLDNQLWAPVLNGAVPGKIAAIARNGSFAPNQGQWDEIGNTRNTRFYVALTKFDFTTSPSTIAMIVPNNLATEVASLVVSGQPSTEHIGVQFGATVALRDGGGNLITSGTASTLPVALSTAAAPTGGSISGTLNRPASMGRATFTGLSANVVGPYILTFTSASASVQSSITYNQIAQVNVVSMPLSVQINQPFTVTVELLDELGVRITGGSGASAIVVASVQTGPTGEAISPAQGNVAAVNGLVTYTGLTFTQAGAYSLGFNAFIGASSQAFTTRALTVENQIVFNGGGSGGCSVSTSRTGWPLGGMLLIVASIAGLVWVRRKTMAARS